MSRSANTGSRFRHGLTELLILAAFCLAAWLSFSVSAEENICTITVKFLDGYGGNTGIEQKIISPGQSFMLPTAPTDKNAPAKKIYGKPAWKPTKGTAGSFLKSSSVLTFEQAELLCKKYGSGNTLTLYSTRIRSFTYSNSAGTKTYLQRYYYEGTIATMPPVPKASGYSPLGWKCTVNGKVRRYAAGEKLTVYGSSRFYASYKKIPVVQVILHYNNGETYASKTLEKGSTYRFPSMVDPEGYAFIGWSTKKGMLLSPSKPGSCYGPGTKITIYGTKHFYAVLMDKNAERRPSENELSGTSSPDTSAYKQIIFLGDSRTVRLQKTLDRLDIPYSKKNVGFVCKGGSGLNWLKLEGYKKLIDLLKKSDSKDKRPIAVIFNFGVNDINSIEKYIEYYDSIAPTLKEKNCRLFIMSVNPVNSATMKKCGKKCRYEYEVTAFNDRLKKGLAGQYTYIDTYSWLMKTGYSSDSGSMGYDVGKEDGLHYTVTTYLRIYRRCLQTLANKK